MYWTDPFTTTQVSYLFATLFSGYSLCLPNPMMQGPDIPDYYHVLEISCTADETAIKASYRKLAKIRHPDKDMDNPDATAAFQLVSPGSTHSSRVVRGMGYESSSNGRTA